MSPAANTSQQDELAAASRQPSLQAQDPRLPTVSVIIPAYNASKTLPAALESLGGQTSPPCEVIVVDDCSTDDTARIAQDSGLARLVARPVNGGAGAARADGVDASRGEILAFLDSDCLAPPDWVATLQAEFAKDPGAGAIGGIYYHPRPTNLTSLLYVLEQAYAVPLFANHPEVATLAGGNMAVRRQVWEQARSGRELSYCRNVAAGEDTILVDEIKMVSRTKFIPHLRVRHHAKDDLWGYLRMQRMRGHSRTTLILNRLLKQDDMGVAGHGGMTLFLGAAALGALLPILLALILWPWAWPWLAVLALGLVSANFSLSRDFMNHAWRWHREETGESLGLTRDIGLRLLLLGRSTCWVLGAIQAAWRYAGQRLRDLFETLVSILHFWLPGRISKAFFFVTARCNARCAFCFNAHNLADWRQRRRRELSLEEIRQVARHLGRLPFLTFSGGEPFLRKDLPQIVSAFQQLAHTRWVTIPTNASLTSRTLQAINQILLDCPGLFLTIQISVDGLFERHDLSRRLKGGFEALIATLRGLARLRQVFPRLRVQLTTPFEGRALEEVKEIREYFRRNFDFDQHLFYLFRKAGQTISDDNLHLVDDYIAFMAQHEAQESGERCKGLWARAVRALQGRTYADYLAIKKRHAYLRPCYASEKFLTIYDEGSVCACEVLEDHKLGSLRDFGYDYYQLKKAQRVKSWRRRHLLDGKCTCEWACAPPINMLYDPGSFRGILRALLKPSSPLQDIRPRRDH